MSFAQMIDQLFNDHVLGKNATYRPQGEGDGYIVRVMARSPDTVTNLGDARLHSSSVTLEARTNEIVEPAIGDTLTIGSIAYVIQAEPIADRERLVWSLDVRAL
jgi:hypothetical protein